MVKINMMCGKRNFGAGWYHVDGGNNSHTGSADILLKSWAGNTVDMIYCSHGIAYFNREEVMELLGYWKRVLKPGGILRLATPDFNVLSSLYQNSVSAPNGLVELSALIGPLYGQMKMGDKTIYHKTVYDFNELYGVLKLAGFTSIQTYDHRLTEHPNTGDRNDKFDDHSAAYINGKLISLNVQCMKP